MVARSPGNRLFARETKGDTALLITFYFLLTILVMLVLYPIIFVISSSFSSPNAIGSGKVVLLPVEFSTIGYQIIFQYKPLWIGFMNSAIYAVGSGVLSTTITLLAAYPLSRKEFVGKGIVMAFFVFTMFFGGGLIPYYLLFIQFGFDRYTFGNDFARRGICLPYDHRSNFSSVKYP